MNEEVVDSRELDKLLDALDDDKNRSNIIFKSLWAGAKVLQKNTKESFRQKLGEGATHYSPYINKPFFEGVTVSGDKAYLEAKVSIMKDYRMKWFETGTVERITGYRYRKGTYKKTENTTGSSHSTGRIKPLYFFKSARSSSESAMNEAIIKSLDNALSNLDK